MDIYRLKEKRMTVRVLSNTLGSNDEDDEDDEEDRRHDRREDVMWNGGVVFNFIRKGRQRKNQPNSIKARDGIPGVQNQKNS